MEEGDHLLEIERWRCKSVELSRRDDERPLLVMLSARCHIRYSPATRPLSLMCLHRGIDGEPIRNDFELSDNAYGHLEMMSLDVTTSSHTALSTPRQRPPDQSQTL